MDESVFLNLKKNLNLFDKKVKFNLEVAQIWREIIFEGGLVWRKLGLPPPPFILAVDAHADYE